ncbi:sugar ABC transporter ATP-binding protein [Treponema primitia]|uniref:sugar ABC transporter ATP-binding protein n=1 Tax=Treponema primitia TaxID=88058 RepID=UPI0039817EEE
MQKILLKMEHISKSFPGVKALEDARLELEQGSILGLLGENGAGKSTLMNVLGGIYKPDEGSIHIDENPVTINTVHDAQRLGIAFIHQELALVPYLSVAENIYLGREIKNKFNMVSKNAMNKSARQYMEIVGLDMDPATRVSRLSTGQQQMVEIAKAFSLNARIVVMDEPTSSLSEKEIEILFKTAKALKNRNIGIIYISHKMSEIFDLTDKVMVMRDGRNVGEKKTEETHTDELIQMMVGRELKNYYVRTYNPPGKAALEVKNLSSARTLVHDCSFTLHQGEVLGFYGLIGAGRSELMDCIMGFDGLAGGEINVFGKRITRPNPLTAKKHGLALVPESRKTQGLILDNTVSFNTSLAVLEKFISWFRVSRQKELEIVNHGVESMAVKTPSVNQRIVNLSGGNQQKVVLAKWLATSPKILILDEPTRGIDVGAKAEIYRIINDLAANGIAIIMVSSELNEVINMSDRLAIMWEGSIAAILGKENFSQDIILKHALGGIK